MKRLFKTLIIFAITIAAYDVGAQETPHVSKVGAKLSVGIANVATSFVELPKTMIVSSQEHGVGYGLTAGFMTGILHVIGRTLAGTLDLATFMIPTQSLVQPEFIWDNFNRETTFSTNWQMRK